MMNTNSSLIGNALKTLKTHLENRWTSPPFISLYIIILISVTVSILSFLPTMTNDLIKNLLTLGLFIVFIIITVRTFWLYYQTKINEFLIFGLVLTALIANGLINFGFLVWFILFYTRFGAPSNLVLFFLQPLSVFPFFYPLGYGGIFPYPWSVQDPLVESLKTTVEVFNIIYNIIFHSILAIYFMRAIPVHKRIKITIAVLLVFNIVSSLLVYLFNQRVIFETLGLLLPSGGLITFSLQILITYLYLGRKAYQAIDPPHPTPRIFLAVKLWKVALITFVVFASYNVLNPLNFGFLLPNNMYFLTFFIYPDWISVLLGSVPFLLLILIALRYPEGLLIFETHLFRAKKAYEKLDEEKRVKFSQTPSLKEIREYLQSIPADFFDEDQQPTSPS